MYSNLSSSSPPHIHPPIDFPQLHTLSNRVSHLLPLLCYESTFFSFPSPHHTHFLIFNFSSSPPFLCCTKSTPNLITSPSYIPPHTLILPYPYQSCITCENTYSCCCSSSCNHFEIKKIQESSITLASVVEDRLFCIMHILLEYMWCWYGIGMHNAHQESGESNQCGVNSDWLLELKNNKTALGDPRVGVEVQVTCG